MEKGKIAQMVIHLFHNVFYEIFILKSFYSTFQLLSTGSVNLEQSQNGVLGNGLMPRL